MKRPAFRPMVVATLVAAALFAASPKAVPGAVIHIRRNAYDPAAPVATYAKGVKAMKARAASDPTSWAYQAAMHGSYTTPAKPLWNQCQHGSFFFLSWHRMYLYYLESIVRKAACGTDVACQNSFALPYWNYSDQLAQRVMPSAFRTPANSTNPLWVSQRNAAINTGNPLPASAVSYSVAFTYTNFVSATGSGLSFGGQRVPAPAHFTGPHGRLESQPHDVVHVAIGGWMSDPNTAAQDPIFWLHHANIDRLWKRWLSLGGGRSNPSASTDALWYSQKFSFYDENGTQVTLTGAQITNTATQLGYRYDDDNVVVLPKFPVAAAAVEAPVPPRPPEVLSAEPASAVALSTDLGTEPVRLTVNVKDDSKALVRNTFAATGAEGRLMLNIEGIEFDKYPDTYYEVYVNLPEGQEPDFLSESYAGNLAVFGMKPHEGHDGHTTDARGIVHSLDLSGVSAALQEAGRWDDGKLNVTLVPQGARAKGAKKPNIAAGKKVRFARITLTRE